MRSFYLTAVLVICGWTLSGGMSMAADKIKVLIVDGQNNHDFERTTPYLKTVLEKTGKFAVFVATTPAGDNAAQWNGFRPQFSDYQVVVSNYNGKTWPEHARVAFEDFVKNGGGVVNVHAANNPHADWPEFNKMIGLGWRGADFGPRLTVDDAGKPVTAEKGQGPGAGHGSQHAYKVVTRDLENPVMKGFPVEWMHPADELYHGQRGPAEGMHILATAYSDKGTGGTGEHELSTWWIQYGKGKVLTTLLGHVSRGQDPQTWPMRCQGFQAILTRGCEWVATDQVTIPLPKEMPAADKPALAE